MGLDQAQDSKELRPSAFYLFQLSVPLVCISMQAMLHTHNAAKVFVRLDRPLGGDRRSARGEIIADGGKTARWAPVRNGRNGIHFWTEITHHPGGDSIPTKGKVGRYEPRRDSGSGGDGAPYAIDISGCGNLRAHPTNPTGA